MAKPNAPTELRATARQDALAIDLRWRDRSSNEAGFRVDRREALGAWGRVKTVGKGITKWTDHTVKRATTYTYRVRAENADGSSAWSNEDGSKTIGTAPVPSPAPAQKVKGFKLVVSGQSTTPLVDGQEIILSPLVHSVIEAVTEPVKVGSVVLVDNGVPHNENVEPYTTSNIAGWTGAHQLTATPHAGANGTGIAGVGMTINLTVKAAEPQVPPEPRPVPEPAPEPDGIIVGADAKRIDRADDLTPAMLMAQGLTMAFAPGLAVSLSVDIAGKGLNLISQVPKAPWRLLRTPGRRPMARFTGEGQAIQDVEVASDDPIDPDAPDVDDKIGTTGFDVGASSSLTIRRATFVDPLGKGFARVRQLVVSQTGDHVQGLRMFDLRCPLMRLGQAIYLDDGHDVLLDGFEIGPSYKGIANGIRFHGGDYTLRDGTIEYIAEGVKPAAWRSCLTIQDDTRRVLVERVKFVGGDVSIGPVLTTSGWQAEVTDDVRFVGCSGQRVREITLRKGVTNFSFDGLGMPWDTAADVVVRLNADNPRFTKLASGTFANVAATGRAVKFFSSAGSLPTSNCTLNGADVR